MKKNILIIDDDKFILKRISKQLSKHNCICYSDSQAALQMLKRQKDHIDMILCDIVMPYMDGVEFYMATKKVGIKIPFYFITGFSDIPYAVTQHVESHQILMKPISKNTLQKIVGGVYGKTEKIRRKKSIVGEYDTRVSDNNSVQPVLCAD